MPVHHRLRFLTFPMRASRLCSLWPDMRPLRFRRAPFGRDVVFDPGGVTASRIMMPHIFAFDGSERLGLRDIIPFVAQSPTPSDHCVRFAPVVTDDCATSLPGGALPPYRGRSGLSGLRLATLLGPPPGRLSDAGPAEIDPGLMTRAGSKMDISGCLRTRY